MSVATGQVRALALLAVVGLLALGAALWATPAQGNDEIQVQQATDGVVISSVFLDGANSNVVILNTGEGTVNLDGWFVCNAPSYWAIPDVDIAPGQGLTLHAGPGADTATDLFATGGFGSLDGDGNGEVALYSGSGFESAEQIQSYVAWNGGKARKSVAQEAGIWGDTDVTAENGAFLDNSFDGLGAEAWFVALPGQGDGPEEPEVTVPEGFGAELSGDNEIPAVNSAASGSFLIDVDAENETATWSLWLANVQDITQAHIHLTVQDGTVVLDNGPIIVPLLDPDDPGVSSATSVHFAGQFDISDVIPLNPDAPAFLQPGWDEFLTYLENGLLYVNVHSVANPGGEIRGQILFGPAPAAPTIGVAVSAGSSLFGWFGADVTSTYLFDQYAAIVAIWFLDAEGWTLDSRDLPDFLRFNIFIGLGTGILIIASDDFLLAVPLAPVSVAFG